MNENKTQNNLEKPEEVIDDIVNDLDALHEDQVKNAIQIGATRDTFRNIIRPIWRNLGDSSTSNPEAAQIYASGFHYLSAIRDQVRSAMNLSKPLSGSIHQLSGSARGFVTATNSTASFLIGPSVEIGSDFQTKPELNLQEQYANRFSKINPALGTTYREIWESLYGTRADPERAALYLMRQAFDQLFATLAPDDEVRKSEYWKPKTEQGKENQIWREERIKFAARKHIRDQANADTLVASVRHISDVYEALNRAHDRGELDKDKSRKALTEMQSILENWADGLDIW